MRPNFPALFNDGNAHRIESLALPGGSVIMSLDKVAEM